MHDGAGGVGVPATCPASLSCSVSADPRGAEVGEVLDRHSAGGTCTKDRKSRYEGERKAQSHGSLSSYDSG